MASLSKDSGIFLALITDGKEEYISLYSTNASINFGIYDLLFVKTGIKVNNLVFYII